MSGVLMKEVEADSVKSLFSNTTMSRSDYVRGSLRSSDRESPLESPELSGIDPRRSPAVLGIIPGQSPAHRGIPGGHLL